MILHPVVTAIYINPNLPDWRCAALSFSSPWCCDRHSGNGFSLPSFFLGPFYTEAEHMLPPPKRKRALKGQNRPTCDRKPLQLQLHAWRNTDLLSSSVLYALISTYQYPDIPLVRVDDESSPLLGPSSTVQQRFLPHLEAPPPSRDRDSPSISIGETGGAGTLGVGVPK
jgi:hypothetical protein